MSKSISFAPIYAHRGASAYAPENTLIAFQEAKKLGATAIEFDVSMNYEGQLFVFHDKKLNRTTSSRGFLYNQSTDLLLKADAGRWFAKRFEGERIPTFSSVCTWLNENKLNANIELKPKSNQIERYVTLFLGQLNQLWPHHKQMPLVSSFNYEVLELCAQLAPELPLGLLLNRWSNNWLEAANQIAAQSIHLSERQVTKKRIQLIKAEGLKVGIYTVNSKNWAKRYYAMGADMLFSDYPDLMNN